MGITPFGSLRTAGAGTLRPEHAGDSVTLAGWVDTRRDHGGVAFLDLRDRSGLVQVVADPEHSEALEAAHRVRTEWVVRVTGTVRQRPDGMVNDRLETGAIEVVAESLEVLSEAETPPFPIADGVDVDETMRLTHRYVDLRRPRMAEILRTRSRTTSIIRRVMERHGFLDVETPMLTRATPEGARDFLVPSRLSPGETYALPQSPQLFKQLLQVAGVERYYQIARCFRDEDLRADRQPEFTQLDVELSFGDQEDVIGLSEELVAEVWREVLGVEVPTPFLRLTHAEAMDRFGSDKPDLRIPGLELATLDEVFAGTEVGVFAGVLGAGGSVVALALPGGGELTRRELDELVEWAKRRGAKGLAWAIVEEDGSLRSPLAKFMTEAEVAGVKSAAGAGPGDAVFFGAGDRRFALDLMGALRNHVARLRGLIDESTFAFCWVVDAPMFEPVEDRGTAVGTTAWTPTHHPFTAPTPEFVDSFDTDPEHALSNAYDVVCNGYELGGGSIRIHDRAVQERVFRFLGISDEEAQEKFGFLLRGLSYGAPPHGGIAFGLDRMVMLLAGTSNIRDVIPFPKTQSGACLLTDAPAPYEGRALDELLLRVVPRPESKPSAGKG
ncbi:MAG: aspartate--tRNA ligase [Actinomycetes bacterium]